MQPHRISRHGSSQAPWPAEGTHQIPFAAYTDEATYRRELERFFYRGHWSYVGLEAEVPQPGDFKRTVIGGRCACWVTTVSVFRATGN